jgi:hypothetical protein
MSYLIFAIPCLFKRSTTVLLRSVKAIRVACQSFLTCMRRRGSKAGTMPLTTRGSHSTNQCSRTDANALDVAIRNVGQVLDVGHVLGVTYDVGLPEGGSNGVYHLHVSLCLIRVEDEVL